MLEVSTYLKALRRRENLIFTVADKYIVYWRTWTLCGRASYNDGLSVERLKTIVLHDGRNWSDRQWSNLLYRCSDSTVRELLHDWRQQLRARQRSTY